MYSCESTFKIESYGANGLKELGNLIQENGNSLLEVNELIYTESYDNNDYKFVSTTGNCCWKMFQW